MAEFLSYKIMISKATIETFRQLRVYGRLSLPLLLNDMLCNRIMKLNYLVNNAPALYRSACGVLGKNFVNWAIDSTYCKVFTAGNTIEQANQMSHSFRAQGTFLDM